VKTLLRILLGVVVVIVLVVAVVYLDGMTLPVNHSTTVTQTMNASPDKVFAQITNVAAGATWRPEVKGVTLLPPDNGRDHWVEDLGHGQTMTFLAVKSDSPDWGRRRARCPAGRPRRNLRRHLDLQALARPHPRHHDAQHHRSRLHQPAVLPLHDAPHLRHGPQHQRLLQGPEQRIQVLDAGQQARVTHGVHDGLIVMGGVMGEDYFAGSPTTSGPSSTWVRIKASATIRPKTALPFAFRCVRSSVEPPPFSALASACPTASNSSACACVMVSSSLVDIAFRSTQVRPSSAATRRAAAA
jgi:hypothetical protein